MLFFDKCLDVNFVFGMLVIIVAIGTVCAYTREVRKVTRKTAESTTVLADNQDDCGLVHKICGTNSECNSCLPNTFDWECENNLCKVKRPVVSCNEKTGGRLVLNRVDGLGVFEFTCVCIQPEFYCGDGCETQNPTVCVNGVFSDWKCICNPGYASIDLSSAGRPHLQYCVPESTAFFFRMSKQLSR